MNQTIPPNLPPVVNNISPGLGSNFVAGSSVLSFDLSDEANVVSNGIVVTLNGAIYTNGSPGMTVTPPAGTAASRHVDLAGALVDNVFYRGTIQASDAQGATISAPLSFDKRASPRASGSRLHRTNSGGPPPAELSAALRELQAPVAAFTRSLLKHR